MILLLIACYLAVINVVTFALFCIDKRRARAGEWRIPEKTLLGLSALGGALGGIAGMKLAHHKTRKWYFAYGVPMMLVVQVLGGVAAFNWLA